MDRDGSRRGYRFVGTVEWVKPNGSPPGVVVPQEEPAELMPRLAPQLIGAEFFRPKRVNRWQTMRTYAYVLATVLFFVAIGIAIKITVRRGSHGPVVSIRSVAVLPLEDLSGDRSQDYFADGMTDELIMALAKNRRLGVISHTSAMQCRGVHRPVRQIARELGVDGILEGSTSRTSDRVHLNVQFVDAATDTHIWAESYDRDLNDAFALPTELSQTIAKEVKIAVSSPSPLRYVNPQAHDLYLRGRYFFFGENDAPGIEYLQRAVEIQPDYAAAWSAIADYYASRAVEGAVPPSEVQAIWQTEARKATELDDTLSDAHNAMSAWYFFGEWDWQRALAESQRAIALDLNNAEAYHLYSYILTLLNRPAEALDAQKKGMEVDPFARPWALGFAYYHQRQFDAAINELRLCEKAMPKSSSVHTILADALACAGRKKEAADEWAELHAMAGDMQSAHSIRQAFAHGGYAAMAEWQLANDKTTHSGEYVSPFWHAIKTARAQHKEATLRLLEAAYREHSPRLVFLQNEPEFDFLHSEPRYQALVCKMALPAVN